MITELKTQFQRRVINWYVQNGRLFLWRTSTLTSWQWLLVELFLRRTRAEMVEVFYPAFIRKYPAPDSILAVTDQELEGDLHFLGLYHQRRRALKAIAQMLVTHFHGHVPSSEEALAQLPHVGPYIQNALLCFCFGQRTAILDINVRRILSRVFGFSSPAQATRKWLQKRAQELRARAPFTTTPGCPLRLFPNTSTQRATGVTSVHLIRN